MPGDEGLINPTTGQCYPVRNSTDGALYRWSLQPAGAWSLRWFPHWCPIHSL